MEIKFWIVASALGIVTMVLGFLLKTWFREIINKLDDLVRRLEVLGETKAIHEQQIKYLTEGQQSLQNRLNDHGKRIRNLETYNNK